MKTPKLKKIESIKKHHGISLEDDYAWVDQPNILEVLKDEGFIRGYSVKAKDDKKPILIIELKYFEGKPAIKEMMTEMIASKEAQENLHSPWFMFKTLMF